MKILKNDQNYILRWAKKIRAINILGGKCNICGDNCISHLEFHHLFGKEEKLSVMFNRCRWSSIIKEVSKCQLLCGNCHSALHFNTSKRSIELKKKFLEIKGSNVCCECGLIPSSLSCLHFHHISGSKSFDLGAPYKSKTDWIFELEEEIKKCNVICRNCHWDAHFDHVRFEKNKIEIYKRVLEHSERPCVDKEKVLDMYSQGFSQIAISMRMGCAKSTISRIIKLNT